MATWSMVFTDTVSNPTMGAPNPQVGDGRPYTAAEWRTFWKYIFARGGADRGVLKGVLNECAVTVIGANDLQVDTGLVMCAGGVVVIETHEHLAPVSAGPGLTRKDSVICELDLDGSGSTEQYTVRVVLKQGTAGAPPAMTQTAVLWQIRLYNYTIDDAGAITGLSDQRQYLRVASEFDHGELSGMLDDDHTQYMDVAGVRHTKAVHDALGINADLVDGFHAADLITGVALGFVGCTVLWGGALGGSDGHRPVSGGAHEDWHWANGELVNGVQTLDSRGKMVIGSDGAAGTYPVNATGGAALLNLAHTHGPGTYGTSWSGTHTHYHAHPATSFQSHDHTHWVTVNTSAAYGTVYTAQVNVGFQTNDILHYHSISVATGVQSTNHNHTVGGVTSDPGGDHSHSVNSGTSASSLSATQSIMNPYRSWYLITYIGT